MTAKDVVAKAKDEGLTLTENYVHTIRSAAKRKASASDRVPNATARSKGETSASTAPSSSTAQGEGQLMALIIAHGLPAVEQMLANVAAKLRMLT